MDYQRAHEIISSPKEYEVTLNGNSVWIEKLHGDNKTATVHPRHRHDEKIEVSVDNLKEEYLIH